MKKTEKRKKTKENILIKNFHKLENHLLKLKFKNLTFIVIILLAIFFIFNLVFYQISDFEDGIIIQFGKIKKIESKAGLHAKLPDPLQILIKIDKRIQIFESIPSEMLTLDKKNLIIDYYILWKIKDSITYLKKLKNNATAKSRIASLTLSFVRGEIGKTSFEDVLKNKRKEINANLIEKANIILADFGIETIDINLKKINFPQQNLASVYERMESERAQIAAKYISEGDEQARKIRAQADKEREIILSKARKEANIIRGKGEAKSMRLYNQIIGYNNEFYQFIKSLDAYEKVINEKSTIILSTDSEFFKYLKSIK